MSINPSELEHNNMVPYFGAKITQSTAENLGYEKLLDVYTGSGSQQNKEGIAPMFKPEAKYVSCSWNSSGNRIYARKTKICFNNKNEQYKTVARNTCCSRLE